ncbi:hypothetical protein [Tengunoibacter tsumagoiensis]|uniref:Glycosyltransferase RgtA/B/C/D-like domain-containing protein n=1 Tax=Tengunoibacter tsumagoiensis TaxID=2014871 RepID=A0A401ZU55_9CHLR|nr:hypothetical protein [Tengunoibacter tsumagoiensis]GCE10326.1 hypothetical protein KTT_01850 [Tengunoibacter tsumagoiensis]
MHAEESALTAPSLSSSQVSPRAQWRNTFQPWGEALLAVLPIYLVTRLVLFIVTYLGGVLFPLPNGSNFALSGNSILYTWYHWDALREVSLATQGYTDISTTGFFPLYPALVRTLHSLFHLDPLVLGMLLSNLAFLYALLVLYKLSEENFDRTLARRSVLYLTIFPTALLCSTATSLSLFLALTFSSLYCLRRGSWWLAGLFGALAALTDGSGCLLWPVFLYEFFSQLRLHPSWQQRNYLALSRELVPISASLLIPLGWGVYAYALQKQFQDTFAFLHPQNGEQFSAPWSSVGNLFGQIFHNSLYTSANTHSLFELSLLLFALTLLVLCCIGPWRFQRKDGSLILSGFLFLLTALSFPHLPNALTNVFDPLPSLQASILGAVMIFVLLARLGKFSWLHHSYLLCAFPLQIFLVCQLLTNHWAF